MRDADARPAARAVAVAAAAMALYVGGAALAHVWVFESAGDIQPFWVATAAVTALGLALPRRDSAAALVGLVVGELVNSTVFFDVTATSAIGAVLANSAELVAALLIFRRIAGDDGIVQVRRSLTWMGASMVVGALGASVAAVLVISDDRLANAFRWWLGDSLAFVTVAPLGLFLRHRLVAPLHRWRMVELVALSILLAAGTLVAFSTRSTFAYLTIPVLIWLALRFGHRVSNIATVAISMWATVRTAHGAGPFDASPGDSVLQVQAYNVAIGCSSLVMAALAARAANEQSSLVASIAARQALERELGRVRSDERRRIAARLHDDAIQVLVAADLQLTASARSLDAADGERLEIVRERIQLAIDELRDTISAISPSELDASGLRSALGAITDRFASISGAPRFELDLSPVEGLSSSAATAIYQVGREAIANAAIHAQARTVTVRLDRERQHAVFSVDDDGIGPAGIDPTHHRDGHLGVGLMHERAAAIGGTLTIGERDGGGTSVRVTVPLAHAGTS